MTAFGLPRTAGMRSSGLADLARISHAITYTAACKTGFNRTHRLAGSLEWARLGSNQRPLACEDPQSRNCLERSGSNKPFRIMLTERDSVRFPRVLATNLPRRRKRQACALSP